MQTREALAHLESELHAGLLAACIAATLAMGALDRAPSGPVRADLVQSLARDLSKIAEASPTLRDAIAVTLESGPDSLARAFSTLATRDC